MSWKGLHRSSRRCGGFNIGIKVAYIGFPSYLSLPILSSIAKEVKKIGVNFYIDTSEEKEAVTEVPENFDMVLRINRKLVTDALSDVSGHRAFKLIKSVRDLKNHVNSRMDFLNPDAIVATSDMGGLVTRLCNEWAVKHNRPFFIMQPSFLEVAPETRKEKISRVAVYLLFNKLLKTSIGRRQHYYGCERKTNYNLVWSREFSNQMKYLSNIFAVGNPLLDKFYNQNVMINVKNPFALICTQPYDKLVDMGILKSHQALEMIAMLKQIVIQNPDVYFYIKVHPSEDIKKYEGLFAGIDTDNFQIRNDIPVQAALKLVDVQISMASYTSFEAVVAGVPIIIIHPEFINFFDQFKGEIEFRVDDIEMFNIALNESLQKRYRERFVEYRKNYLNKKLLYFGHSAETTANTIRKVVEWRKNGFK